MKKIILLAAVLLSMSSCLKKATTVNFTTELSVTSDEITVNEGYERSPAAGDFSVEFTLDMDNPQVHDYLDKLKDLDLENVRLRFQGLSGLQNNQVPTHLRITFDDQITIDLDNFVWANVAGGQEYPLTQTDQIERLAQLLLQKRAVNVRIQGQIPDSAPYHFFITLAATAHITAGLL